MDQLCICGVEATADVYYVHIRCAYYVPFQEIAI
jgi:hypothetical protein